MSRSNPAISVPPVVRAGFGAMQAVAPALAARTAERLFFTPPRPRAERGTDAFLQTGERFALTVGGRRVVGWRWGSGPLVYLVHGWGSRGGRMAGIARPLIAAGYGVVTWDAPGHGASGRGMSSMPEFARTLGAIVSREGPAHAVVGHSLGAAAAVLATTYGTVAPRYVLLAPPASTDSFSVPFAEAMGATPWVMEQTRVRSERRLDISWNDLDIPAIARRMTAPLLVVHDRGDRAVPLADGQAVAAAWPGSRLVTTMGLGHRGVTRDALVAKQVVAFIEEGGKPQRAGERARLEAELFEPGLR